MSSHVRHIVIQTAHATPRLIRSVQSTKDDRTRCDALWIPYHATSLDGDTLWYVLANMHRDQSDITSDYVNRPIPPSSQVHQVRECWR